MTERQDDLATVTREVLDEIGRTRRSHDALHTPHDWLVLIGEEYGEACSAAVAMVSDGDPDDLASTGDYAAAIAGEMVQIAALAMQASLHIKGMKWHVD